jgi:nickel-dependent lactate racemase
MALTQIPFGKINLPFQLKFPYDWYEPKDYPPASQPLSVVTQALQNPLSDPSLEWPNSTKRAAISINDKTRPVPYAFILPPLLDWLNEHGIPDEHIELFVATGTHTPATIEEIQTILPAVVLSRNKIRIFSHDCDDRKNLIFLGTTQRGTPVWVNKRFYQADLRIVTGNIEPHHFMGYSGGVKSAAIGLAGRQTINHNHAMLNDPLAFLGEYEQNPMRQDVEEIGSLMGIHLALNVILNANRQILAALFGTPRAVMEKGISISDDLWKVAVSQPYDLVIASAGGHPKDINLYQAQKAITHAALFARPGGVIILAAACPEGIGSQKALDFIDPMTTPDEVIFKFRQMDFQIGPHKAYQIALQAKRNHLILVSEMPHELVRKFFIIPANSIKQAVEIAQSLLPAQFSTVILPHATALLPKFQNQ